MKLSGDGVDEYLVSDIENNDGFEENSKHSVGG